MRPINLNNVSNKVISKIMSTRLTSLLCRITSENQTGFIQGRSITENVLLAQEIIHNMARNVVIKDGYVHVIE